MSDSYINLIKELETLSTQAYKDASQYSIGYGTRTDDPDEIAGTKTIDEAEASRRLTEWTKGDYEYIQGRSKELGLDFNSNEMASLVSFTYNTGRGNFDKLTANRSKEEIADAMLLYNKSEGVELEGLNTRRARERELFMTPVEEVVTASSADRSYLDYTETMVPASLLRSTPAKEGEDPSVGELWEAAKYRHWTLNSMLREGEAWNEGGYDPEYKVTKEELVKFNDKGYTGQEIEFLAGARSNDNMAHRIQRIDADRQAKQVIESAGWGGTGIEMAASIVDPLLIPTLFLGGAGAAAGKWNSAKAIGASFLSGSSQAMAVEYLLKVGDTQRTNADVLLAGIAGGLFSSSITAGARGYAHYKSRIPQAEALDLDARTATEAIYADDAYNAADATLANVIPDAQNRKRFMTEKEIVAKLQEEVGTRADAMSSRKIKKAKQEFRDYRKGQMQKIDNVKKSLVRPSAKVKQIEQLEKSIARREEELNKVIADNNAKLQTNSRLDQLQQGKIPEDMLERYNQLKKEAGEFDAVRSENLGKTLPDREAAKVPTDTPEGEVPTGTTAKESVGAMKTVGKWRDIMTHDQLLQPTDIDEISDALDRAQILADSNPRISRLARKALGVRSLSSLLDEAPDSSTRGLAMQLFKNGTRTIQGHQSAEELAETLFFRNVPDYLDHERSFENWLKKNGGGGLFGKNRGAMREQFDKEVVLYQASRQMESNKVLDTDDDIVVAAKMRSRIYERSLKNNKDYDVVGWDKIEHRHDYHSVVISADNILSLDAHMDDIVDCLAKSYQTGGIKLSRENALRVANTWIDRVFTYNHGSHGLDVKAMSDAEFRLLDKELKEQGVEKAIRDDLKATLFDKDELGTLSPRAMFSLRPNLTAASNNVRMVDLVDTGMDRVMKYASDSAGNAGLASQGFKSKYQFARAMAEARNAAMTDLRLDASDSNPKIAKAAKEQLAKHERGYYQDMMMNGLNLIYRQPLEGAKTDALDDAMKILRKQNSITRLRTTGLMSIPEYANGMVRIGGMNVLKQVLGGKTRFLNLTEKSIEQDEFMKSFADAFSATGHQEYLFGKKFYNNSDFDDATKSRLGNMINMIQGKAMNVTMTVNGFRTFQHGGEEAMARAMTKNLRDAITKGTMDDKTRQYLTRVGGMSPEQVDEMVEHFKANPDMDVFHSVRQMRPELYNSLSVAMRNTMSQSFLRMGVGETAPYMNKEMGKVITALLSFTLGSWEKMIVRGIKSDGLAMMSAMFAGQAALGTLVHYAHTYLNSQKYDGIERDKYIDKQLSDDGMLWGVINRVGYMAAPMMPVQMMASMRMLPDWAMATPTQSGVQTMGLPVYSYGEDVVKAAGSATDLLSSTFSDEYMSNKERERNWNSIRRVLPWVDSLVYSSAAGITELAD